MTKVNWSWICWRSATRKPIRMRRADHLPRRSPTKADQLSTFNLRFGYAVLELFGNDGSDSSSLTQGNLSSSQIVFCGANGAGSSSDAIVTSIVSESLASSKNKCVPQHAANERIRFACAILRGSPVVRRSEERRVGKECRAGWSRVYYREMWLRD